MIDKAMVETILAAWPVLAKAVTGGRLASEAVLLNF